MHHNETISYQNKTISRKNTTNEVCHNVDSSSTQQSLKSEVLSITNSSSHCPMTQTGKTILTCSNYAVFVCHCRHGCHHLSISSRSDSLRPSCPICRCGLELALCALRLRPASKPYSVPDGAGYSNALSGCSKGGRVGPGAPVRGYQLAVAWSPDITWPHVAGHH